MRRAQNFEQSRETRVVTLSGNRDQGHAGRYERGSDSLPWAEVSRGEDNPSPSSGSSGFSEKTPRFVAKRQRRRPAVGIQERDRLSQKLSEGREVAPHEHTALPVIELWENHGDVRKRDAPSAYGDKMSDNTQRAAEQAEQRQR
jgi:hypothetical protein